MLIYLQKIKVVLQLSIGFTLNKLQLKKCIYMPYTACGSEVRCRKKAVYLSRFYGNKCRITFNGLVLV